MKNTILFIPGIKLIERNKYPPIDNKDKSGVKSTFISGASRDIEEK